MSDMKESLLKALKGEYRLAQNGFARPLARGIGIGAGALAALGGESPIDAMEAKYQEMLKSSNTPGTKMNAATDPTNVATLLIPEIKAASLGAKLAKSALVGGGVSGASELARQAFGPGEDDNEFDPKSIARSTAIGAGTAGIGGGISGKYGELMKKAPPVDRAKSDAFIRSLLQNPTNDPEVQALIEASIQASKPKVTIGKYLDDKMNRSLDRNPTTSRLLSNLGEAAVPLSPIAAKLYNDTKSTSKAKQDKLK